MKTKLFLILMLVFFSFGINAQITPQAKQTANKAKHSTFNRHSNEDRNNLFGKGKDINSIFYKPGKEIHSNWDTLTDAWIYSDSLRSTYNTHGNEILDLYYYGGTTPDKRVYVYNANQQLTSDTSLNWNGTSYSMMQLQTYAYDVNGNQTEYVSYYGWTGTAWNGGNKEVNTYDGNNNQIVNLSQNWTGTVWEDNNKYDYTWVGGQMTEEMEKSWDGTAWVNISKVVYTYASGQCSGLISYSWDGTTWQNEQKFINIVWYQWTGNLDNDKLTSITVQLYDGTLWKDTMKIYWTYDINENQTDYLEQSKSGVNYISTYEEKDIFLYDGNNNMTEDIYQEWDSATQGVINVYKTNYSDFFQFTTAVNVTSEKSNVAVYPNPFTNQAVITFSQEQINTTVNIMDLQGKVVKTFLMNGTNNLIIEREQMKAGIYFVQIMFEKRSVVNKNIIVQ